jgi:sodium/hydrogen exchanger-like protein 6/7
LFGEGIMNDAISIVIFRSIKNFLVEANDDLGAKTFFLIMGDFIYLLVASVLIGLIFGLGISYFFKKFESYS